LSCSAVAGHGGIDGVEAREGATGRRAEVRLGGDVHHMRAQPGSARPNAAPVVSSRHCSPVLHGSCPPACLRRMGSARANRSGWSPGSEWKELVGTEPRGATSGKAAVRCPYQGQSDISSIEAARRSETVLWCTYCGGSAHEISTRRFRQGMMAM
jgi:hypothetical protein